MALSAVAIKAAKSRDKPYKLADRDGLYLEVSPTGARSWRMNYRYLGKQKTLTFGRWPAVGLADARKKCDAAREVRSELTGVYHGRSHSTRVRVPVPRRLA